nr:hypothetical protein Iba_chr05aCG8670 [Ipomoea batatas]
MEAVVYDPAAANQHHRHAPCTAEERRMKTVGGGKPADHRFARNRARYCSASLIAAEPTREEGERRSCLAYAQRLSTAVDELRQPPPSRSHSRSPKASSLPFSSELHELKQRPLTSCSLLAGKRRRPEEPVISLVAA